MLTVILDTNVFISSVIVPHGVAGQIYKAWRDRRFLLASSHAQLREIERTLSSPKIRRRYPVTDEQVDGVLSLIGHDAILWPGTTPVDHSSLRDPNDTFLLALAVESRADFLVSGDEDLLVLGSFEGTRMISPREFLGFLAGSGAQPPGGTALPG